MMLKLSSLALLSLVGSAAAQSTTSASSGSSGQKGVPELVGTWSTLSNKVSTGSGFWDPSKNVFIEPELPGFSYSFTKDGYYEEAYYRAISNPQDPSCPRGIMQFQHGSYEKADNGSLVLTPIKVDGRQLMSDPCKHQFSTLTRYNQTELFLQYEIENDSYWKKKRLTLYQFNGAPLNPMWLKSSTPSMLPTSTLDPVHTATHTGKSKRDIRGFRRSEQRGPVTGPLPGPLTEKRNADAIWWFGLFMASAGGLILAFS